MGSRKKRVLFTTNIPSPYMVEYLDQLGTMCDLTVLFELSEAKDRIKQWYGATQGKSFQSIFLNAKALTNESGLSFQILKYLDAGFDRIVIANPTTPTGIVALLYCRMKKIPFVLQSEGGFRGSGKGPKERFKKFLMEKAEFYLSGMQGDSDYFLSYGATKETLRWYPFTSLKREQLDQRALTQEEKTAIRETLGIREAQVILSVGSPIPRKGFDILLQAKTALPEEVGFYIVGGEAAPEYLEIVQQYQLKNVHFISYCDSSTLRKYYHAADIFVLATREDTWGLVINEAMANGLPVITTDRCIAGLQLIENDVNGYLVPVENSQALGQRMLHLLQEDSKRHQMARNNIAKIQPYCIEEMAQCIASALGLL